MTKVKSERVFTNPFTESFLPAWELWKEYKSAEFKFKYKSVLSEQSAINLLVKLSSGDERIAVDIIQQSMGNGWQGFFPLKSLNFKGNGQGVSNPGKTSRESVNDAYSKRFGSGGQSSPVSGTPTI